MPDLRPSLLTAVAKTANRARARGPGEVLSVAMGRIKEWFSSSDDLVMFVGDPAPSPPTRTDLTFRAATAEDGPRYARDIGTDSAKTFAARLSPRTHCFIVEGDSKFLHASWVTTAGAWTRELRSYLVPPDGGAYIYESFTRADARGRGVYPFALAGILGWAAGSGIPKVWVAVEEHNPPSLRAVSKADFEEAFRLPFARRLGRLTIGEASGPLAREGPRFLSGTRP